MVAAFSGFSVDDVDKAKQFYSDVIGLPATSDWMGLKLTLPGGAEVFVYGKEDHKPASFTILNFVVEDIDKEVDAYIAKGVTFEHYDGMHQDDKEIARGKEHDMGPNIAWFKDPAGNILSLIEN